jgi:hypothetical protein
MAVKTTSDTPIEIATVRSRLAPSSLTKRPSTASDIFPPNIFSLLLKPKDVLFARLGS